MEKLVSSIECDIFETKAREDTPRSMHKMARLDCPGPVYDVGYPSVFDVLHSTARGTEDTFGVSASHGKHKGRARKRGLHSQLE